VRPKADMILSVKGTHRYCHSRRRLQTPW